MSTNSRGMKQTVMRRQKKVASAYRDNPYSNFVPHQHNTRTRTAIKNWANGDDVIIKPHVPRQIFKGETRPSWVNYDGKKKHFGQNVQCYHRGCTASGDTLDHIIDWKNYIRNNCDLIEVEMEDGWICSGYDAKQVRELYNDIQNLQPMCSEHNSSKNAEKGIDLRPLFKKRR